MMYLVRLQSLISLKGSKLCIISYTSPDREKNNSEFDYYNDKKPQIAYGIYYMLEKNSVMICNISCASSITTWGKSEELRGKLLERCRE